MSTPGVGTQDPVEIVIEAGRTEQHYWRDLWRYRELFYFLAWRDILVRYKQTAIGVIWALLRPLLTMIVFTIVFGRIGPIGSACDSSTSSAQSCTASCRRRCPPTPPSP